MMNLLSVANEQVLANQKLARVEVSVTAASELIGVTSGFGYEWKDGSLGWDITTGDFYALKADGTWYNQDGTGALSNG